MHSTRDLPLPVALVGLLVATGLSLFAAPHLPAEFRGLAIAGLSLTKAVLVVLGFMRLQRESRALAGALIAYATLVCLLAGGRIALAGLS
ncbi:cytochrome C oxidase subunit IV family protein [Bosea robiniae]|uniref:Cytochrome C oxidase subunit IV n=1 Tax=Bosea robiniae TaxID=1036780 RepID=A0ABY0P421_9HYPH|nr:Cytochrome C oxidase subunit IV [Bosea robiniae]